MTNKEWLETLDAFDKAVVLVNFVRNVPQQIQTDCEAIKREFRKWLREENKVPDKRESEVAE